MDECFGKILALFRFAIFFEMRGSDDGARSWLERNATAFQTSQVEELNRIFPGFFFFLIFASIPDLRYHWVMVWQFSWWDGLYGKGKNGRGSGFSGRATHSTLAPEENRTSFSSFVSFVMHELCSPVGWFLLCWYCYHSAITHTIEIYALPGKQALENFSLYHPRCCCLAVWAVYVCNFHLLTQGGVHL